MRYLHYASSKGCKPKAEISEVQSNLEDLLQSKERKILELMQTIADCESEIKDIKDEFYTYMLDNNIGCIRSTNLLLIKHNPYSYKKFDSAKFKKSNPELYNKFSRDIEVCGYTTVQVYK